MRFSGCFSFLVFLLLSLSCYSQQKKSVLTNKIAPELLREDAKLFRNVALAMHPVIGIYESLDQLFIETAVSVCDIRPSNGEHAWISGKWTSSKLRKLVGKRRWQIRADHTNLFFDDVGIVHEPFRSGRC